MDTGKSKSSSKAERHDKNKGGLKEGQQSRGGAYRKSCLDMDEARLAQVFDDLATQKGLQVFEFGEYNDLGVTQAASPQGLIHCQHWIKGLLQVSDGTPRGMPLKQQILRFTSFNGTDMKHDIWSGSVCTKLLTIMNHWRRLKSNPERRRQALQKASCHNAALLSKLLALEPRFGQAWKNASEACKKAKKVSEESSRKGEDEACNKAADMTVDKSWIENGDDVSSEVSMDSKGYPMMLKTPDASKERSSLAAPSSGSKQSQSPPTAKKGRRSPKAAAAGGLKKGPVSPKAAGAKGLKEGQSPSAGQLPILSKKAVSHREALLQQAQEAAERLATMSPAAKRRKQKTSNEVKKKPAMGKRIAKRPAASMAGQRLETRPALKRPASQAAILQEQGSEIRPGFSGWLKVKAEKYTKQGYIKGWWGEAWTLLVACSEKQATNYPGGHGAVIDALLPHCDTQGMTKEKLVELRNDMLAQHKI